MGVTASVLTKRDRRHNDLTTDLDVAIRHFNRAFQYRERGQAQLADDELREGGLIVAPFADLLMIDPEAIT